MLSSISNYFYPNPNAPDQKGSSEQKSLSESLWGYGNETVRHVGIIFGGLGLTYGAQKLLSEATLFFKEGHHELNNWKCEVPHSFRVLSNRVRSFVKKNTLRDFIQSLYACNQETRAFRRQVLEAPLFEEVILRVGFQEALMRQLPKRFLKKYAPSYEKYIDYPLARISRVVLSSLIFAAAHFNFTERNTPFPIHNLFLQTLMILGSATSVWALVNHSMGCINDYFIPNKDLSYLIKVFVGVFSWTSAFGIAFSTFSPHNLFDPSILKLSTFFLGGLGCGGLMEAFHHPVYSIAAHSLNNFILCQFN